MYSWWYAVAWRYGGYMKVTRSMPACAPLRALWYRNSVFFFFFFFFFFCWRLFRKTNFPFLSSFKSIMPRHGTGKRSQSGNWQSVPGMLQTCPCRALANVPRQGTGKRPWQGLQTCPGKALANVPKQGSRKRPQAGDSGCSRAGKCRHCTAQKV